MAGFDVGTTTLIAELRDLARSISHQLPDSCEKRAADCIEARNAEIASLCAALEKAHARIDSLVGELADSKEYGLIQWRKKDVAVLDAERARAELADLNIKHDHLISRAHDCVEERDDLRAAARHYAVSWSDYDRLASDFVKFEATARQDAETIARLREALETIAKDRAANREPTSLA